MQTFFPSSPIKNRLFSPQAVGILRRDKTVTVATSDGFLTCYSSSSSSSSSSRGGKRLWQVRLPATALCLQQVDLPDRGLQLAAVALRDGKVMLFDDKQVVDCFR